MAIRGLFYGVLMLAIGGFFTLGLATVLEQQAIEHNDAAAAAPIAGTETPSIADGTKPAASRWMF